MENGTKVSRAGEKVEGRIINQQDAGMVTVRFPDEVALIHISCLKEVKVRTGGEKTKNITERVNVETIQYGACKGNQKLTTVYCKCGCGKWYGAKRMKNGKMTFSYICIQCGNKEVE